MSTSPALESVIRFILFLVFVGWLIIWIVLPTETYRDTWRPNLEGKLYSTYFGDQGIDLVFFSIPMMFIAALSCVYVYRIQKEKPNKSSHYYSTSLASFWRRPASVRAPLGIVTAMELCFAVMFVALLVWSLANYIHVGFSHLHSMHMKPIPGLKEWEAKLRSVSYRLGLTGNICLAFLFFPVTRGSSILALFGLTSESSIKYHIWLGHISMVLFAAHALGYIVFWAITHQMAQVLEWSSTRVSNVAGEIAIVFAMAMWVTSIPRVRRKMFELFFYTHQLYTLYIVFYILHAGVSFFSTVLPGIFLFIIDRYLRFLQSYQRAELVSARILPCETIELNFSKSQGLDYTPTSILFINVPSVSKMQWHPFTVTSNSKMETDKLSVVIKSLGSWSQKLYQQLSSNSVDHIQVSVEGPYGPTSSHFLRHKALVMISGGSGITPMISIIRELIFQSTNPDCHVPPVKLICAFKNSADLTMLQLLLPISSIPSNFTQLQFQIQAYVTRETQQQPPSDPHKLLQTLLFKTDPLDSPISLVLGRNTWLWLGAIISSSFLLFLFVLGIVTHFYIYPIGKNTGEHYHVSFICLWYMFLVCASIFIVSSAVFLWCKRQNAIKEGKQTQNEKFSTPRIDVELESSPGHNHESLIAQATQVHYGTRPDLKKILLETKGSDIGVLVCGPKKMRHDVATVCSSSLAHNLHFESISFNW